MTRNKIERLLARIQRASEFDPPENSPKLKVTCRWNIPVVVFVLKNLRLEHLGSKNQADSWSG